MKSKGIFILRWTNFKEVRLACTHFNIILIHTEIFEKIERKKKLDFLDYLIVEKDRSTNKLTEKLE